MKDGKARVELKPEEFNSLLVLVNKEIQESTLEDLQGGCLHGLFVKLNRGYRKAKTPLEAVGAQR